MLYIIVAMDNQNGIGFRNTMPWHLPEDLIHFKNLTLGHTVIMGRKTFDSIGKTPLPNRNNIVMTRNIHLKCCNIIKIFSIEEILKLALYTKIFIIGGSQIYIKMLPFVDKLIVTKIHHNFNCDTYFPKINTSIWQVTSNNTHFAVKKNLQYTFLTYDKKFREIN